MQLYKLTEQHKALQELAEIENDQCIADTLEGLEGEFNDKAVSLIYVANNIDNQVNAIDAEIKRLNEMKKSLTNKQNSMKEYLRTNMEATGITKIECPYFSITLAKGRDIVQIDDESKIPADYLNIKTSVTPIKADILKALKAGEEIPGCCMVKSGSSIRIK